jgi:hypothetical protein
MGDMTQTTSDPLALPVLSAKDLKGFDRRRVALIREMESHGWRGRRGSKQHIVMRAPDGETTTCISPKVISPKNEHDVARDFRRWQRQQEQLSEQMMWPVADAESVLVALAASHRPDLPEIIQEDTSFVTAGTAINDRPNGNRKPRTRQPEAAETVEAAPVDTAPETEPEPERTTRVVCDEPGCGRDFQSLQYLNVHKVRAHVRVECPICGRSMAPGNLPRHQRKHAEELGTYEQVMRRVVLLEAENARLRDESAEWARIAENTEAELVELTSGMRNLLGIGD